MLLNYCEMYLCTIMFSSLSMLIKVHLMWYMFYDEYYYVFVVLGRLSSYEDYIFFLPTVLKQVE